MSDFVCALLIIVVWWIYMCVITGVYIMVKTAVNIIMISVYLLIIGFGSVQKRLKNGWKVSVSQSSSLFSVFSFRSKKTRENIDFNWLIS